jgi:GNAT superfamily N-acetyltransferase
LEVDLGTVRRDEHYYMVGVISRAMRDNPNHVMAFGEDPATRLRTLQRFFSAFAQTMREAPICARRKGVIVGIAGMAPPGRCQLGAMEKLRLMPGMLAIGPSRMRKTMTWMKEWQRRDPAEPHWHLGPVGVELALQGMGVGSKILAAFGDRMDEKGAVSYLETDKKENVAFYEKAGFEVIEEAMVIGTPNWFMRREPR